jgi:YjbE family integral membrane protein
MLETFLSDLGHLTTSAGLFALLNIILIDLVMSWDNAILIGMATKKLTGSARKKAIFWGITGATILRIIFSLGVVFLLQVPGLQFLWAILLLYVVWKFYREIRAQESHESHGASPWATWFWAAIKMIIIADVAMSLDNVLAVAGASHGNIANLTIGLIVSIVLMVIASNYIAKLLEKYPSIQWVGLFVILFTALEMLEKGLGQVVTEKAFESNAFLLFLAAIVSGFAILQAKHINTDPLGFAEWAKKNGKVLMMCLFILAIITVSIGDIITQFMDAHHGYKYGCIMICVLGIMEMFRMKGK